MVLADIIRRNARRFPNKLAFVFKENRFTFKEYEERVNRLTNALKALGTRKGDRISVILDNCHQHYEILGAAAKGGFVMSPLSTALRQELTHMIGNAKPTAIIVGDNHADKVLPEWEYVKNVICVGKATEGMHNYEELVAKYPVDEPGEEVTERDGLLLYYTSGTTGVPKGPYLSNGAVIKQAENTITGLGLRYHNEIAMTLHPLFFTVPTNCTVVPAMYLSYPVVIVERFSPEAFLKTVQQERVTTTVVVPTMIFRLLQHPDIDKYDLSSLRLIEYGSATMPIEVLRRAIKKFGNIFAQGYGLTEAVANCTVLPVEEHKLEGTERETRRLASCGCELPNCWVRIVKEDGTDIKRDLTEIGEIIVKCEHLMQEYLGMPEVTANAIKDGWLYTGDMAAMDEDGYIYIKDRKKDMIVSGGINIFPREIEEVLFSHPKVLDAAVIGKPDTEWGEIVKAFIIVKGGEIVTEREIIDYIKGRLATYKKPKEIQFLEALPKTSSGKTLKRELRDRYG